MSTLEIRTTHDRDFIHWPGESPQQVCARLYPGGKLMPASKVVPRAVNSSGTFRQGWIVDNRPSVMLVELP